MENKEEFFIYIKSEISKINSNISNIFLNNIENMDSKNYNERYINNIVYMLNELDHVKLPYRMEYNKYIKPFL